MTRVAFFGHDVSDSAIRRRVNAFVSDGLCVDGFMMRRSDAAQSEWSNVDLGRTYDSAFLHRLRQIFKGAHIAAGQADTLRSADVIYARNLDMLACAFLAKRRLSLKTPVVYECLDVHRLLVRKDLIGVGLRFIERRLLGRTKGLVVSSPAFLTNHFERHHKDQYRAFVIENRLPASAEYGPRPNSGVSTEAARARPLRIGWVGILRCQRSFKLLQQLADTFGDSVDIRLYGKPARTEIEVFEPEIERRDNMQYFGPYKAPEDLEALYADLDVVWSGDFMEAGYNSVWLLPNRIYEGGYYGSPPIVVAGTQSAEWVASKGTGFVIDEPLETTLPDLIGQLIADRQPIAELRQQLLMLPECVFVQPRGELGHLLSDICGRAPSRRRDDHEKKRSTD